MIGIVMSVQQAKVRNDAYEAELMGGFLSAWRTNVCRNVLVQYLSPFWFKMKIHAYGWDLGEMSCPWRERNTILRLSFFTLMFVVCVAQIVIVATRKGTHFWKLLYWFLYVLFLLHCVMFLLDADGLYNGYNACNNNFDVAGFGPIVLTLSGSRFTTTLPPYFYSNPFFIPYQNYDSDTLIIEDWAIVDGCYLTPFIYTVYNDIALMFVLYLVYRMAYIYDHGKSSAADADGVAMPLPPPPPPLTAEGGTPYQPTKKYSLADYDENRKSQHASPAYPKFDMRNDIMLGSSSALHEASDEHDEINAIFEPADWKQRRPSYEKNFS
eukprot:CAMPEP_0202700390 /NCGR_PEP_ID=MMETSP1385-20130828/13565_1 /ASSEMBLY_ACC=CAM_ASM_000861 /TAXON_ID=933848 /ORGANISM="Elphidium margaritaceum" /LENGTH=323 /DNA_ID=CAMNT_0049357563 /DNA_START=153 /DNA_END=1124 /DNA_ORIENTATION=-